MSAYLSDEEQIERLKKLIKTYGNSVLTGVLLALIAYFGWQYWQQRQAKTLYTTMNQYQQVVEASQGAGLDKAAQSRFISNVQTLVAANPNSIFALQALLLQAKVTAAQGELDSADKALTQATGLKVVDQGLSDITWLRLARVQLAENKLDPALASLSHVKEDAFSATSNELRGDILLQKKDTTGAKQAYEAAWAALAKRQEVRELLRVKLNALGITPTDITVLNPILSAPAAAPSAAPAPVTDNGAASS